MTNEIGYLGSLTIPTKSVKQNVSNNSHNIVLIRIVFFTPVLEYSYFSVDSRLKFSYGYSKTGSNQRLASAFELPCFRYDIQS